MRADFLCAADRVLQIRVAAGRPSRRAIARTGSPRARPSAISSRSATDRYRPDPGRGAFAFTPPASCIHRHATGWLIPAATSACRDPSPARTPSQNRTRTAAGLGPVVGVTAAQSARNTLAAGVPVSRNAAQFLGHLPGQRGARGPVETGKRPLLLIDEASTMPGPDLADLIAYARARRGKLILAGDTSQLQAVENGGGMSLLAGALGYARLAEPARFRAACHPKWQLPVREYGDAYHEFQARVPRLFPRLHDSRRRSA